MSIALTQQVKALSAAIEALTERLKAAEARLSSLESGYTDQQQPLDLPPKRRGRPPKYENV
jgi:hypothetical protein